MQLTAKTLHLNGFQYSSYLPYIFGIWTFLYMTRSEKTSLPHTSNFMTAKSWQYTRNLRINILITDFNLLMYCHSKL